MFYTSYILKIILLVFVYIFCNLCYAYYGDNMFDVENLNKQNDRHGMINKFECVKAIYQRALLERNFDKYVNNEMLQEIYSGIRVCHSNEKFVETYKANLTRKERESLTEFDIPMAFTDVKSNLIYIKYDTPIEVIVHEIVHAISNKLKKDTGIKMVMKNYLMEKGISLNDEEFVIDSFNESITHYITQLLIPEIKVSDGYNYGASIIGKYSNTLLECGRDYNLILDAYFKGNQQAFDSMGNDFKHIFEDVVVSINKARFWYLYKDARKILSEEHINSLFEAIKANLIAENKVSMDNTTIGHVEETEVQKGRKL